jgi:hypothetical protein
MDDVYQITGLSDIMRGQTEASETLGAQQLKSQYGSVRIRDRQDEMVRIARDITRIAAEIMAENFQPRRCSICRSSRSRPTPRSRPGAPLAAQLKQLQARAGRARPRRIPKIQQLAKANPDQAKQIIGQVQQAQGLQGQIQKLQADADDREGDALLREQRLRPFVLDIETDSTIAPDEDAQKQRATEFVTASAAS